MKAELQNKLYNNYPKLFRQKDLPMSQTCMCWGICAGDGWYSILDALCASIQGHIDGQFKSDVLRKEYLTFWGLFNNWYKWHQWRTKNFWKHVWGDFKEMRRLRKIITPQDYQIEVVQVKEKFGGLRFYVSNEDEYISGIIHMAAELSIRTCEKCGRTGQRNQSGWIITLCQECRKGENG